MSKVGSQSFAFIPAPIFKGRKVKLMLNQFKY
jgi:hypothetical protein